MATLGVSNRPCQSGDATTDTAPSVTYTSDADHLPNNRVMVDWKRTAGIHMYYIRTLRYQHSWSASALLGGGGGTSTGVSLTGPFAVWKGIDPD